MKSQDSVAIFNSSEETVDLVKDVLEKAGFVVVFGHVSDIRRGALDLEAFIRQHRPKVIVYDLVPPYEVTWAFLEHLRGTEVLNGVHFVLTSANPHRLNEIVAHSEQVYEIVGKPYDLDQIVRAVKEASRARPTR
jgi:DNA-binding NtrC family response regulator